MSRPRLLLRVFFIIFGIYKCCKTLKDLAPKNTPVTIVLRADLELKLTPRKTVETAKNRGTALRHALRVLVRPRPGTSIVLCRVYPRVRRLSPNTSKRIADR